MVARQDCQILAVITELGQWDVEGTRDMCFVVLITRANIQDKRLLRLLSLMSGIYINR